jgi:hypothetical protein
MLVNLSLTILLHKSKSEYIRKFTTDVSQGIYTVLCIQACITEKSIEIHVATWLVR